VAPNWQRKSPMNEARFGSSEIRRLRPSGKEQQLQPAGNLIRHPWRTAAKAHYDSSANQCSNSYLRSTLAGMPCRSARLLLRSYLQAIA